MDSGRLRRGDGKANPWTEYSLARLEQGEVVWWVDLAYWSTGAELRAHASDRLYPVIVVPILLARPFLDSMEGLREQAMRFLKQVSEADKTVKAARTREWEDWKKKHPALAEYLETDAWPDGRARLTSTLLIFMEEGAVKTCLNDREAGRSLWVTAGSIDEAIEALEATLQAGSGDWKASGGWAKGKGSPNKGKKG